MPDKSLQAAREALTATRYQDAIRACHAVLAACPEAPEAMAILGSAIGYQAGGEAEGIGLIRRACELSLGHAHWHSNLAGLYRRVGAIPEALAAAREAITLVPGEAVYHLNLARVLGDTGDEEASQAAVFEALARDRHHVESHLFLGELLLRRGEFRPGWRELDWLDRTSSWFRALPSMAAPRWSGMRMPHGRLLLIADQGFGDAIQFARFIPEAAARCAEVVLICDPALLPLLRRISGVSLAVSRWEDVPPHAAWSRLTRLPLLFGTELQTIPHREGYLEVSQDRTDTWRRRIEEWRGADCLCVGLAWAGNPNHANDHRRSIPLERLRSLLALQGVRFVALQCPIPERDAMVMRGSGNLLDVSRDLTDFQETAAAIQAVDLVVSVDSAAGHVAGALGKEAWILLPHRADWRWLTGHSDSPWYAMHRLYRQGSDQGWQPIIDTVTRALHDRVLEQKSASRDPMVQPPLWPHSSATAASVGTVLCVGVEFAMHGAALALLRYVLHLRRKGMDVEVVPRPGEKGPLRDSYIQAGVIIHDEATIRVKPGMVAIANTVMADGPLSNLVGKVPTLWWIHEALAGVRYLETKPTAAALFDRVDGIVFYQPTQKELFDSFIGKLDPWRLHFVPPPVDPAPLPVRRDGGDIHIVSVGSVYPRKRHADLIAAVDMLPGMGVHCTIVGQIHGLPEASWEIIRRRPDRFTLTGALPQDATLSLLSKADIYSHPSADESMAIAPLEAAARRVPVVIAQLAIYRDIWRDEMNCLMHKPGHTVGLAEQLGRLIQEADLRRRLANAAWDRSRIFHPDFFLARMDAALAAAGSGVRNC